MGGLSKEKPGGERRLLTGLMEFVADNGKDAVHLSKSHHATMERVACIVTLVGISKHCTTMIDSHRKGRILAFENTHHLDEISTAMEMVCLNEISIRQNIGATEVNKVGAAGILTRQRRHIIMGSRG